MSAIDDAKAIMKDWESHPETKSWVPTTLAAILELDAKINDLIAALNAEPALKN